MLNLLGKTALITGATGGIGRAIVRALNRTGVKVFITGTDSNRLNNLAQEIGGNCTTIKCDLKIIEDLNSLTKMCEEHSDGIDILVNNAGITQDNLLVRMKDHEWENVIDINLTSNFKLSKSCLRNMMKKRFGRIINISSIVGVTGNPGQSNYSASKAGIVAMAKSLAQEVASRGITVNNIAPGFISTAMTDALTEKQRESILASIPAGRFGVVEDIASCVLFLASDEASYITGQTLHINGGMAMI
ncbi:MAG: beta-ketoacyl-ACP reductase [Rhodospirillaceae bacterium]|nr:beta-ketoacyl-ACP reductase [Rhodospirillaceae bacterium]OUT78301.1 MAG: beta-ketoacyl-ACP reductase [Rhodospirillaceae bacterium TMED23]